MIVKDEEPVIGRCLSIVSRFADEMIVIDTGSKDRTMEIAKEYTDRVFEYPWEDNFSKARNISYSKASCDYIMWMDADDVIRPEGVQKLRELMASLEEQVDVIFLPYIEHEKGKPDIFDYYLMRDRIIRRSLCPVWENPVHEAIRIKKEWKTKVCHNIPVYHDKVVVNEEGRNLRIFEKSMSEGWKLSDYSKGFYCRELSVSGRHEQAAEVFCELLRSGARESIVHYALYYYIYSMEQSKRYRELKETLLQYTQRYPETGRVCCGLGKCYVKEYNLQKAECWYRKALEIKTDDSDRNVHCLAWSTVIPWVELSKLCLNQHRFDQAQHYLDQAKELAGDWKMIKVLQIMLDYRRKSVWT